MKVLALVLATTAAAGGVARADGWLVAETPAAFAISDAQQGAFRAGLMPAVGVYAEGRRVALGFRLRAGALRNGPAPAESVEDPGMGGLVTGTVAARLPLWSGWIELAAGGGVTGSDWVPAVEGGAGWTFRAGPVDVGPSVRLVRVVSRDDMGTFGTADLVLVGVDVRVGKERRRRELYSDAPVLPPPPPVEPVVVAPPPAPPPAPAPVAAIEADADRAADHDASCIVEGCPKLEGIEVLADRLVLEESVLFDLNGARLRSGGRGAIARIAQLWGSHREWRKITVEGHACDLGGDALNQQLSEQRAASARAALIAAGVPADRIEVVGYGASRPRDPGHTDAARVRNRRVEFVIERGGRR